MTDRAIRFSDSDIAADAGQSSQDRSLSDVLRNLALNAGPRVSMRDLAIALEERSFGAFLTVFALPNLIPMPPGATFILGLPLMFVTWQMMASRRARIWLPAKFADYSMDNATFVNFVTRMTPWLKRVETFSRPRFWFLQSRFSERVLGVFALMLATVIFLPIPFGNWLPALALSIMGLTLTQRDGLGVIASVAVGLASMVVVGMVLMAAGAMLAFFL